MLNVSPQTIDKLANVTVHAAKNIQCLPDQASNCGSLHTIGWYSIQCKLDILKLLFMWRVLLLPMKNIYKIVLLRRIIEHIYGTKCTRSGPTFEMLEICKKYSLINKVIECINNGEYFEMVRWKELVYKIVKQNDVKKWKVTCSLQKSLKYIDINVQDMTMSTWWVYTKQNVTDVKYVRCIIQLLLGKDRQRIGLCNLCNQEPHSIHHILFECTMIYDFRKTQWANVTKCCNNLLVSEINKMSNKEKCKFILNGFYASYTPEWNNIYMSLAKFVYFMYNKFENLLEELKKVH